MSNAQPAALHGLNLPWPLRAEQGRMVVVVVVVVVVAVVVVAVVVVADVVVVTGANATQAFAALS